MSVTLWVDDAKDEALSLGETFAAYAAFSEMAHLARGRWEDEFGALAGVLTACEDTQDADPSWLADVRIQSRAFASEFGDKLSDDAKDILDTLSGDSRISESVQAEQTELREAGFSGIDSHGHKWVNGKQVKIDAQSGSEPSETRAGHNDPRESQKLMESKLSKLVERIKEVPHAVVSRVGAWVKGKYDKLSARYGPTGAKAILGAMILLMPSPIPGSSLIPIAAGEAIKQIRKAIAGSEPVRESAERELSADEVNAIARELLHELYESEGESFEEEGDAEKPAKN